MTDSDYARGWRAAIEAAAKVADERASLMNRLGSDAKQERRMTIAELQAERRLEALCVRDAIRALVARKEPHR